MISFHVFCKNRNEELSPLAVSLKTIHTHQPFFFLKSNCSYDFVIVGISTEKTNGRNALASYEYNKEKPDYV